ncbi:MAG: hydroxylase [Verrucomicrobia bacterium]|nr:hydroxylase [Verrucomicrobiota bacterium]
MKMIIDTEQRTIERQTDAGRETAALYSPQGFEWLSELWLKVGWDQKYSYTFTWLGRPLIQLPEDVLRIQEVIFTLQPEVIVETGVAHGGSLIFYASLCKALGKGRVIGIDIEIRPDNRKAIEQHALAAFITLMEGSSTDGSVLAKVRSRIAPGEKVLVLLDSCHSADHVLNELEAYHSLVPAGSYLVATDGIMRDLHDLPRGRPEWLRDNPVTAARTFVERHPEFVIEQPRWLFNESSLKRNLTYWPEAFLKRVR